jgi:hypothetical protein
MYLVESLTRTQAIADLGISIRPGLPKVISPEDFAKSLCLAELVRQGHLRVSRTSLCREELPPKRGRKPGVPVQEPTPAKGVPASNAVPPRSPQRQGRREAISEGVATTVEQVVATTVKQTVTSTLKEVVESAVRSALDSAGFYTAQRAIPEAPKRFTAPQEDLPILGAAPMFIPSGLVPKEASGEVSVSSQTQTSDGLGDSASALKKLRKGSSK